MAPSLPEQMNDSESDLITIGEIRVKYAYGPGGFKRDGVGVCVHVTTLCDLEFILEHFRSEDVKIRVKILKFHHIVCKEDVMAAAEVLKSNPHYAVIFAYGVDVMPEASQYADQVGVKIYSIDSSTELFHHTRAFLETIPSTST